MPSLRALHRAKHALDASPLPWFDRVRTQLELELVDLIVRAEVVDRDVPPTSCVRMRLG